MSPEIRPVDIKGVVPVTEVTASFPNPLEDIEAMEKLAVLKAREGQLEASVEEIIDPYYLGLTNAAQELIEQQGPKRLYEWASTDNNISSKMSLRLEKDGSKTPAIKEFSVVTKPDSANIFEGPLFNLTISATNRQIERVSLDVGLDYSLLSKMGGRQINSLIYNDLGVNLSMLDVSAHTDAFYNDPINPRCVLEWDFGQDLPQLRVSYSARNMVILIPGPTRKKVTSTFEYSINQNVFRNITPYQRLRNRKWNTQYAGNGATGSRQISTGRVLKCLQETLSLIPQN